MFLKKNDYSSFVKSRALSIGFDFCGIAVAEKMDAEARLLENWLQKGMHGKMQYMEKYFDLRIDPSKIVPGAKSVITLLMNYFPSESQGSNVPKISKYAYGNDYHDVIRPKLQLLLEEIKTNIGDIHGRGFIDSAPVLERSWAVRSGLGWVGKNGNLITKEKGSFFFIATLITDLELIPDDHYAKDYCGTCNRCVEACPTEAILDNKVIDGSKCISYFTIELKDQLIPASMKDKFDDWLFGCDTCQDVCPWNRFAKPTSQSAFTPIREILDFSTKDWVELQEETFKNIFRNSPLKRAKFNGIRRNLQFIQQ